MVLSIKRIVIFISTILMAAQLQAASNMPEDTAAMHGSAAAGAGAMPLSSDNICMLDVAVFKDKTIIDLLKTSVLSHLNHVNKKRQWGPSKLVIEDLTITKSSDDKLFIEFSASGQVKWPGKTLEMVLIWMRDKSKFGSLRGLVEEKR